MRRAVLVRATWGVGVFRPSSVPRLTLQVSTGRKSYKVHDVPASDGVCEA